MKVLFATTNPSKVLKYEKILEENGIELVTIKDLGYELDIEENGKDSIENAFIKAKAYYDAEKIPTIGMDDSLFIEELPEEKQPGTYVRRVNGKELDDDEMIEYYTNLAKEYGGKLTSKWIYGMVICTDSGCYKHSWSKENFYLIDKPCENRNPRYPLNSISIDIKTNKYFVDLNEKDKERMNKYDKTNEVVNFILNSLNK